VRVDHPVTRWLLSTPSTTQQTPRDFLAELVGALADSGFALGRVSAWIPTLHPELWGTQLIWDPESGCRAVARDHGASGSDDYVGTPGETIHQERVAHLRCRLDGPREQIAYELLRSFKDRGGTDYLMLSLDPGGDRPPWIAFVTQRPGGFSEAELELLISLGPLLGLHFQLTRAHFATQSLLEVYLGPNAARRVLAGEFRRGSGTELRSAMWFCDMRGFTTLSDRLPPRDVVRILDTYFETVAAPIERHGGEILKLIGDAALAIFPIEGDEATEPCTRALAAADEVLESIASLSIQPPLGVGVGLHIGDVMYGNIGGRGRLDFTVIGGSVNEVCRVEALCKPLGCPLLMTRAFATALGRDDLVVLGRHELRGVSAPQDILTTRARAPSAG
jgi:adenylate cyclase